MSVTALKPVKFPWLDYSRYSFSLGLKGATGTYLSGTTASELRGANISLSMAGPDSEHLGELARCFGLTTSR